MTAFDAWRARFESGDVRALARALTWVEADDPRGAALRAALAGRPAAGRAIGVTGPPGAGKSTLVDALIGGWRARGARVAVLAVDPSSPRTGGALLGDRVRMTRWSGDADVYVRSMASRGRLGGVAPTTLAALALLLAFGFDVVLLETVGVGQAEVDVVAVADTTLVVLAPGQGDDVQAAKAGVMEVADVFVLAKSDRPGAARLAREVREAVGMADPSSGADGTGRAPSWRTPVVPVALGVAAAERPPDLAADGGLGALLAAIDAHAARQAGAGGEARPSARARFEAAARADLEVRRALGDVPAERWSAVARGATPVAELAASVLRAAAARLDP